jgi:hypothetical protein
VIRGPEHGIIAESNREDLMSIVSKPPLNHVVFGRAVSVRSQISLLYELDLRGGARCMHH